MVCHNFSSRNGILQKKKSYAAEMMVVLIGDYVNIAHQCNPGSPVGALQ